MQTILDNTRGLSLLLTLQWDRMLNLAAVGGALAAGSWLCSIYVL
jgi:hypothetical protein